MRKRLATGFELFISIAVIFGLQTDVHDPRRRFRCNKYVASNTMTSSEWQPSVFLSGDIAEKVSKLKQQQGPDLLGYGNANLVQTLMKHELVDAFWLKIHPLTLGSGKRLFVEGTIPAAFKVTESKVSPNGIIIVNYQRAGAIKTGSYT